VEEAMPLWRIPAMSGLVIANLQTVAVASRGGRGDSPDRCALYIIDGESCPSKRSCNRNCNRNEKVQIRHRFLEARKISE
jgi:hypothetical protein